VVELRVPEVGESISQVEIGRWLKSPGEQVRSEEPLVEIESEKATIELPSPADGILSEITKQTGETARIGEVIGLIDSTSLIAPAVAPSKPDTGSAETAESPAPPQAPTAKPFVMPAAQRLMDVHQVETKDVSPSGPGSRVLKEDVLKALEKNEVLSRREPMEQSRKETVVRMSPIRRTIAARLLEAQQNAALLTTFNEIDMLSVKTLREHLQEEFQKRHGVKLGYMSFFVRAVVRALHDVPEVNAQIRGDQMVRFEYCDIGVAIGAGKGLVVPVLRNAEKMSFAAIEQAISDFAVRAKENRLKIEELQGGTFTITNGGVYGSLMSTPLINPPQSAVLGMHAIQDRPVALEGQVVIRPMMYVALTYDHRLIDGREAVTFLKRIKELIEKPILLFDF